jgi:signal transduction histidine kinase
MFDMMAEQVGGGIKMTFGGEDVFISSNYHRLQGMGTRVNRQIIPVDLQEGDGVLELASVETDRSGLIRMAEAAVKGDIATGAIHDLNNLLGVFVANLECLVPLSRGNVEASELVAEMNEALLSITGITSRMTQLLLSRREVTDENLHELAASAIQLIKKRLQTQWSTCEKQIRIVNGVPPNLSASVVHNDVQLALVNLLTNAAEHGIRRKGVIIITGNQENGCCYIGVANKGKPVPASLREKLLQEPVTEHCNNGFGLYSSAQLVRAFGGDITFESDCTRTIFTIKLPSSGTDG